MADPWSLFDRFMPTEGDQKSMRRWRMSVGLTSLLFLVLFSTSPLWGPRILETKAAAQEIHQQIKDELTSVGETVKELSKIIEAAEIARAERERERTAREKESTIRLIRQQIYETQRDACGAAGQVRSFLLQQVAELRSEFMALTGTEYPMMTCEGF